MIYRVTSVCAFIEYERDEDASVEELIEKITGKFQASAAMQAGTAFHQFLEDAVSGLEVSEAEALGHRFMFADALQVEVTPIRELRASKTYMVDGEPITISGQVDALDGLRIEDHKTTSRFDADRYLSGYQWRLYLDIFGATSFRWNVFEIDQLADDDMPTYLVKSIQRLEQCRYPELAADCQAAIERFARFVRQYIEGIAA